METTLLILTLVTGHVIDFRIPMDACAGQIEQASAAAVGGEIPQFEVPGLRASIMRIECDGRSVVLALPTTDGPCELEASS